MTCVGIPNPKLRGVAFAARIAALAGWCAAVAWPSRGAGCHILRGTARAPPWRRRVSVVSIWLENVNGDDIIYCSAVIFRSDADDEVELLTGMAAYASVARVWSDDVAAQNGIDRAPCASGLCARRVTGVDQSPLKQR